MIEAKQLTFMDFVPATIPKPKHRKKHDPCEDCPSPNPDALQCSTHNPKGGCFELNSEGKPWLPEETTTKDPSLGACPKHCPYRDGKKSVCKFTDQGFIRMDSCPCHVLQGGPTTQNHQIENIEKGIAKFEKHIPSMEVCQCTPCPDGVIRCGIGDTACPVNHGEFERLALCPLTNPRRVRQILREKSAKKPKDPRCTNCSSSDGCATHNPDEQKCAAMVLVLPAKKPVRKKILYRVIIQPAISEEHPYQQRDKELKYRVSCEKLYGDSNGLYGCRKTREGVIYWVLSTLNSWKRFDSILNRNPDPISAKNFQFIEETGEFNLEEFFDPDWNPKPEPERNPERVKVKRLRKKESEKTDEC